VVRALSPDRQVAHGAALCLNAEQDPLQSRTHLRPESIRYALLSGSVSPFVFVINRICRLILKRKGMGMSVSTRDQPALLVSMSI
jgi:hypothetical protein